jgi:hypothetical protein
MFKIEGLDELRRNLSKLQRRAENLSGPVKFDDLFPPEFMRRYTDVKSIDQLLAATGRTINTTEDFEAIPSDEWDRIVKTRTRFSDWDDMKARAGEEYAKLRLGL